MSTLKNMTLIEVLKTRGWSVRAAGKHLRCNFSHLYRVATGERESRSLTRKILSLPKKS